MADVKQEVLIDLKINKGQAEKDIDSLTNSIISLTDENKKLTEANKELEKSGQKNTQAYIDNSKQIEFNKQEISKNTAERKSLIQIMKSEEGSIDGLRAKNAELTKQRNSLNLSTKEGRDRVREINSELDKNNKTINENTDKLGKQKIGIGAYSEGIKKALTNVAGILASAFSIGSIISFGKAIFDLTGEFQRYEAVLTNTLGSNSRAQLALTQISKFASETPFSVRELTESFVKLANQGFEPTASQMRKLGDIASSTGKTFDGLAEAIIDAQTGEFERLKEFGIRASKSGDQVAFTFKGVQTQTEFTSEAIRDYILSLGDAEGVSGSMAAISQTLEGQVSNLGDAWDQLLLTLGSGNSGIFAGVLDFLKQSVTDLTLLVETTSQQEKRLSNERKAIIIEDFNAFAQAYDDRQKAYEVELATLDEMIAKDLEAGGIRQEKLQQERETIIELREQEAEAEEKAAEAKEAAEERKAAAYEITVEKNKRKLEELRARETAKLAKDVQDVDKRLSKVNEFEAAIDKIQGERLKKDDLNRTKQDLARVQDQIKQRNDLDAAAAYERQVKDKLSQQEIDDIKKRRQAAIEAAMATLDVISDISRKIVTIQNMRFKNESDKVELNKRKELKELEDKFKRGLISQEQFNQGKKEIEEKAERQQLEIKRKAFETNKKNQIVQSTIDAIQSAVAAFRSLAGVPFVGPVLAPVAAAAALAFGFKQVQEIKKSQFVGAQGGKVPSGVRWGTVGGRPHSAGGTKYYGEDGHVVELEKDEGWFVSKVGAHQKWLSGMSRNNEKEGGRSWFMDRPSVPRTYQLGGNVNSQGNAGLSAQQIETVVSSTLASFPPIVVTVDDINTGQNRVAVIDDKANLL